MGTGRAKPLSNRDSMSDPSVDVLKPFRWDITKLEQLGGLVVGEETLAYDCFETDLRTATAKVVARAGDNDLVFLGRSPENLFDYLSGIFHNIKNPPSLTLLQFSNRNWSAEELAREYPAELDALFNYFTSERLDPASIASFGKGVRFIDVVASGGTFGSLVSALRFWSNIQFADWNAIERRIGFVGLVEQRKHSPNTWRWWQHQEWVRQLRKPNIGSVSIPWEFWRWIANNDEKVTQSHHKYRWASVDVREPVRYGRHLKALRLAVRLFELGQDKDERKRFISQLAAQPEMKEAWLRSLILRLKGKSL